MLQGALLTGAVGVEQGQLAAACVAAEQREVLLVRDHMHADVTFEKRDDRPAVGDPECNVVESLRLHATER